MSITISTIQQSGTTTPARSTTIFKHAAVGGVVGAAVGVGLSFTGLPLVGGLFAPIAAAIGGVAGLAIGGLVGFLRSRGGSDGAKAGVTQVIPPPPGTSSGTLPPPLPS